MRVLPLAERHDHQPIFHGFNDKRDGNLECVQPWCRDVLNDAELFRLNGQNRGAHGRAQRPAQKVEEIERGCTGRRLKITTRVGSREVNDIVVAIDHKIVGRVGLDHEACVPGDAFFGQWRTRRCG